MKGRGRKGGNEGGGMEEAGRDGRRDGRKGERAAGGRRAVLRPPDAQPPLTAASDASSQGEASRRRDRARPARPPWSECRWNQARFQRTRRCRSCARREQQLSMLPAFAPSRSAGRLSREVSGRCGAPANLATGCNRSRCVCCCRRLATAEPMLVGRPWAAGRFGPRRRRARVAAGAQDVRGERGDGGRQQAGGPDETRGHGARARGDRRSAGRSGSACRSTQTARSAPPHGQSSRVSYSRRARAPGRPGAGGVGSGESGTGAARSARSGTSGGRSF